MYHFRSSRHHLDIISTSSRKRPPKKRSALCSAVGRMSESSPDSSPLPSPRAQGLPSPPMTIVSTRTAVCHPPLGAVAISAAVKKAWIECYHSPGNDLRWVACSYPVSGPKSKRWTKLELVARGTGGYANLLPHLREDAVVFALFKVGVAQLSGRSRVRADGHHPSPPRCYPTVLPTAPAASFISLSPRESPRAIQVLLTSLPPWQAFPCSSSSPASGRRRATC
jgi:hypothetical protein